MKHRLLAFGIIVLVMVAFVASPAIAQTTANGPYYATPSWDQTLACTALTNCPRFIVLANMSSQAVLDRETGLVWLRRSSTNPMDWEQAQLYCNSTGFGVGRFGWHLPTLQELASLVDPSVPSPGPAIPIGHPFIGVKSDIYWSANTSAASASVAWVMGFGVDLPDNPGVGLASKDTDRYVWCVRGGQGVDPQ